MGVCVAPLEPTAAARRSQGSATLNPDTSNPKPYNLNLQALNPIPWTQNPKPKTRDPGP